MNTFKRENSRKQVGFTLVELAVVLAIVSVLVIGSTTLFKEQKVNIEQDSTADKLKMVKASLLRFVELNQHLPCPDPDDDGSGIESRETKIANFAAKHATFGRSAELATETSPFIPSVPATPAVPARTESVDVCTVHSGLVPFKTLGLSLADVTDGHHNRFHYAVTQGVTSATKIADCPKDSACFFNRNSAPAFDYSTEPVSGALGDGNLRVCSESNCSGANLLSDGLLVVVLAYNKNASSGLSVEEQNNLDGDKTFIKARYNGEVGSAYFDDLLVTVSGAEISRGERKEFQVNQRVDMNHITLSGNDEENMFGVLIGGVGDNDIYSQNVQWDQSTQTFDFGANVANQNIVLKYNTYAEGSWNQPDENDENITSDVGRVLSNPDVDTNGNIVSGTGVVAEYKYGDSSNQWGEWTENEEFIVTTDENGQIELVFEVGTTAETETINFTDIELIYYNIPPPIPSFPSVGPISGIPQTEGL